VTGLDFSPTAIKLARDRARAAGVEATFLKDDLTDLRYVNGTFDLLMDFGALNDLNQKERDLYMNNVLPLSHLGSHYILMCFENKLTPEEVERRFGEHFSIETLVRKSESVFSRTIAIYLMTRNQSG
jgi:cyclopropane fatty-acyl-phospholipid synthase-like methyltransferase